MEKEYTDIYNIFSRFLDMVDDPLLSPSFELGELDGIKEVVTYVRKEDTIDKREMEDSDVQVYLNNIKLKLTNYMKASLSSEFQGFELDIKIDEEEMAFYPQLDYIQETVLVLGMINAWIDDKIYTSTMMRPAIHDRNYQESSHSAQMTAMSDKRRHNIREMRRMVNNYVDQRINVNARG